MIFIPGTFHGAEGQWKFGSSDLFDNIHFLKWYSTWQHRKLVLQPWLLRISALCTHRKVKFPLNSFFYNRTCIFCSMLEQSDVP